MKTQRFLLRRRLVAALAATVLAPLAGPAASAADAAPLTVFAAASLTNVLETIGKDFTADSGVPVRFSFAASSALAKQIESGAPAGAFVSADQEWMDYLQQRRLIAKSTRRDVVTNTLVLVAPADSTLTVKIARGFPLATALGAEGRLATGDPASVPVGKYAKAALTKLDVWDSVASRVIPADNVRTALNFVARGEAPLGIVYGTDARVEPRVKVLDTFPASSHERISYPAAAVAADGARPSADAERFVKYLGGAQARKRFAEAGFGKP